MCLPLCPHQLLGRHLECLRGGMLCASPQVGKAEIAIHPTQGCCAAGVRPLRGEEGSLGTGMPPQKLRAPGLCLCPAFTPAEHGSVTDCYYAVMQQPWLWACPDKGMSDRNQRLREGLFIIQQRQMMSVEQCWESEGR